MWVGTTILSEPTRDASSQRHRVWTLPDLWTQRTRPQILAKPQNGFAQASTRLIVLSGQKNKASEPIGDNVFFSVGSKALGPVAIGSDVMIGANAVVTADVPDNSTVLAPSSRIASNDLFKTGQARPPAQAPIDPVLSRMGA